MRGLVERSCFLPSEPLTSPPFSPETLAMIVTGWDYPTLMATPDGLVEELMLYRNTVADYRSRHGDE